MTCARCEHFTTKDVSPRAAAHGLYRCTGYLTTIEACVSWDQARCGGYRAAKNQEQREQFIQKMESKS